MNLKNILYSIVMMLIICLVELGQLSPLKAQIGLTKTAEHAMVVSADKLASEVGAQIMRQGGNAIDAAVATHFALAVTFPQAGNIGGGGFMVYKPAGEAAVALDFREKAPAAASRNMYLDEEGNYESLKSKVGPLAAGIPGSVAGLWEAHQRYGKLAWSDLLAPAIRLAEEGFPLSYHSAQTLNRYQERFSAFSSTMEVFSSAEDNYFTENTLFVQRDLAQTLKRIADEGKDGFYAGETARLIADYMRAEGGLITEKDLSTYDVAWREILEVEFHNYTLHLMPPSSSGGVAIAQMLGMLDAEELIKAGFLSAEYLHQLAEAMRRAFADRATHLGDSDFYEVPIDKLVEADYLAQRWSSFSQEKASSSATIQAGKFVNESTETTHYSIIDKEGNAVAVTTTLNGLYGNMMVVDGAGFFLNNEMDDFSAQPGVPNMFGLIGGEANAIEAGKRMLSSMTPTLVSDQSGKVRMILGAAGGPRIINAVLQTFLAGALFDIEAQKAVAAPRIHHQWMPDRLHIEDYALGSDTRTLLRQKGHRLVELSSIARSHLIFITNDGQRQAGVDPRGRGWAAGY